MFDRQCDLIEPDTLKVSHLGQWPSESLEDRLHRNREILVTFKGRPLCWLMSLEERDELRGVAGELENHI